MSERTYTQADLDAAVELRTRKAAAMVQGLKYPYPVLTTKGMQDHIAQRILALLATSGTAALACKTDGPMAAHDAKLRAPDVDICWEHAPNQTDKSIRCGLGVGHEGQHCYSRSTVTFFWPTVADKVNQAVLAALQDAYARHLESEGDAGVWMKAEIDRLAACQPSAEYGRSKSMDKRLRAQGKPSAEAGKDK